MHNLFNLRPPTLISQLHQVPAEAVSLLYLYSLTILKLILGCATTAAIPENIPASTARDRKSTQSRESRVKLMSIRDVLHDR